MTALRFVDTNVLIYAHDAQAGARHDQAARLMADLWQTRQGILSTQVLQEFYVNVTRKIARPIERSAARMLLDLYATWPVVAAGPPEIKVASELEERYQLSFWDALIIAAARKGGAAILLTEDLTHGQEIAGVKVVNPFA